MEQEAKHNINTRQTHKWKSNTHLTLSKHTEKHCSAFKNLLEVSDHTFYEPPRKRRCVIFLTNSAQCKNPGIVTRKAGIDADKRSGGIRENFDELTASHLIEACPVQKKKKLIFYIQLAARYISIYLKNK